MLVAMVLSTMPMLSASWSRKVRWISVKRWKEASSSTALTSSSNRTGSTTRFARRRPAQAGDDGRVVIRELGHEDLLLLQDALPDQPLARDEAVGELLAPLEGIGAEQLQDRRPALGVQQVEGAVLGRDDGGQLREDQPGHRHQVLLALEQAREAGQVGLEPVLLGVLAGRLAQVADHLVDVVLQRGDLAAGLDLDRARQVPLGDGGGDLGDGADLGGQVGRELVDVVGEVLPGAGGARHAGLPAQPPLDPDLARHRGHLVGEGRQGVDHAVDRVGQGGDLPLGLDRQLALQVAVGDRGHHLGDPAHLRRQAGGHHVDVVGEVLPDAGDAPHLGLAAQLALGADLAGHPGDLRGERAELVDHGVDGVLQLEDLALDVDGDLPRQVPRGRRRS